MSGLGLKVGKEKGDREVEETIMSMSESFIGVICEQYGENQWNSSCVQEDFVMIFLVVLDEECNMIFVDAMKYFLVHVYVGNLGNNAAKHELEAAFSKYGQLVNVWVARNPPGFAFVEFEDPRDAEDATKALDGSRICNARVRVEMSTGRSKRDRYPSPPRRRRSRNNLLLAHHHFYSSSCCHHHIIITTTFSRSSYRHLLPHRRTRGTSAVCRSSSSPPPLHVRVEPSTTPPPLRLHITTTTTTLTTSHRLRNIASPPPLLHHLLCNGTRFTVMVCEARISSLRRLPSPERQPNSSTTVALAIVSLTDSNAVD
ncbi:RNA recognition motif domain [Trinorchestia longiramus]|nr:RNA recognition motif domain [Trinorchestia longiramus]